MSTRASRRRDAVGIPPGMLFSPPPIDIPPNVDVGAISGFVEGVRRRQDQRAEGTIVALAVLAGSQFLARYLQRRKDAPAAEQPTEAPAGWPAGAPVSPEVQQNVARAKRLGRGPMADPPGSETAAP